MHDQWSYEEGIAIKTHGEHISKDLAVFYNPAMKINRDTTLLFLASYFHESITACDPLVASGIRQLRILSTLPERIRYWHCGDLSEQAISEFRENMAKNGISSAVLSLNRQDAHVTMASGMFDFIEIDPFGSPVPFLDLACQRVKHRGIISVTATDTAALCGTYPKKTWRRYGIQVEKMYWYEEAGLRNLIAYCQRQAAKYDKRLVPVFSYVHNHFYKVFLRVEKGRGKALSAVDALQYIHWDPKTQHFTFGVTEEEASVGRTYVGPLQEPAVLDRMLEHIGLLQSPQEAEKLLKALQAEPAELVGYYNPHKLEKAFKFNTGIRFATLLARLKEEGFQASRVHNNPYGIKTDADYATVMKMMGYRDD